MPLFALNDDSNPVTSVPHQAEFDKWKGALTPAERQAIHNEFDRLFNAKLTSGEDIVTSSWLPDELCPGGGQDWDGTPFQVIYDKACRQSWQQTGWCFGLFLWEYMMQRPENWHFMKCELDGVPIAGTTYF